MKKLTLILFAVVTLCLTSCNNKTNPNSGEQPSATANSPEAVMLDNWHLALYDAATQSAIPCADETDTVVNMVFDNHNHLYYTVSVNDQLKLRMIDFNEKKPQPKDCIDWQLRLNDITDKMMGFPSNLSFNSAKQQIAIGTFRNIDDFYFSKFKVYDIASGKLIEMASEEYYESTEKVDLLDGEQFYEENRTLYRVTPQGKTALNDRIDFSSSFEDTDMEEMSFDARSVSPDHKQVVYAATVQMGEGWGNYCLANLDGSRQMLLPADVWEMDPVFMNDGSLLMVGKEPRPESDPEYDPDYNATRSCTQLLTADGTTKTLAHGTRYALNPAVSKNKMAPVDLVIPDELDMVILDHGKIIHYNSKTNTFVPYELEKDSVVNVCIIDDNSMYYTVLIGNELYLKQAYMDRTTYRPMIIADWDLKPENCISETYGKFSPLEYDSDKYRVSMYHTFSWEYYGFSQKRSIDLYTREKWDGYKDEEEENDSFDAVFQEWLENQKNLEVKDDNYYYKDNGSSVCLSDKIDFNKYISDPAYAEKPEFNFLSFAPNKKYLAYTTILEYGDLGHGPLCLASTDGKLQMAFEDTDAPDLVYGWLNDGSLVYVGKEPRPADDPNYDAEYNNTKPCIKKVSPNGKVIVLSHASDFVTLN